MKTWRVVMAMGLLATGAVVLGGDRSVVADWSVNPITPTRVLDTRAGTGGPAAPFTAGQARRLELPETPGIAPSAVAVNLTVTDAAGPGHLVAWPCGVARPETSVLNFDTERTVANLAIVGTQPGGVCLESTTAAHVVGDVVGLFGGSRSYTPQPTSRILDTRPGRPVTAASPRRLTIENDATSRRTAGGAVLNITVVEPRTDGFVALVPCAHRVTKDSLTSVANFRRGETVAALALAPLGEGPICVWSSAPTHLIVDQFGRMPSTGDLQVQLPRRIFDSRITGPAPTVDGSDNRLKVQVAGRGGVPHGANAAFLTVTAVSNGGFGYATAWPCDEPEPLASTLNVGPGEARSNMTFVALSSSGQVCVASHVSTGGSFEIIADVAGWILADSPPDGPPPSAPSEDASTSSTTSTPPPVPEPPGVVEPDPTVPESTTTAPTTSTSTTTTTTSTLPPPPSSTTTTTTSTLAPSPSSTTTIAPPTTPDTSGSFVETFAGNTGLERFRTGVFHRDVDAQTHGNMSGSWQADHNIHLDDCGNPHDNSHTVTKADRDGAFYVCREHMMTSVGHVDGYSVAWFSPDQTFTDQTRVSWDVNVTDLGTRQWWEVAIVPVDAPDLSCISWLPCNVPEYPDGAVVVSNMNRKPWVWSNGNHRELTWRTICISNEFSLDPEGCGSKAIRRPWSVTDNQDGTLTVRFHTHQFTTPGSFPDGEFKVVFKDHNYTPDKDGKPIGYTWHWDNIIID